MLNTRIRHKGVTAVECSLILSALMIILFFLLDFGLVACRYNTLRAAADMLAREAITHGAAASPEKSVWGPASFSSTSADAGEPATFVASRIPTMNPSDVAIQIAWPDNDTDVGDRLQVELTYTHHPIIPLPGLRDDCELTAVTTMRISH